MTTPVFTILSAHMTKLYQYLIFSQDAVENKLKVIDFSLETFPEDEDWQILHGFRAVVETTKALPSYEFLVSSQDFPYTISAPLQPLGYPEAWALVLDESKARRKNSVSKTLMEISQKVVTCQDCKDCKGAGCPNWYGGGVRERLERLLESLATTKQGRVEDELEIGAIIEERQGVSSGPITFIPEYDERMHGVEPGTILTFMGYVGSYKTTFGLNFLHGNAVRNGYNGVMITLEIPKKILYAHIISRHTNEPKFAAHGPVNKSLIQKGRVSEEDKAWLRNIVQQDLRNNPEYGKFEILEMSDFSSFSRSGIRARIRALPFIPDFLIFDYIQLCQYLDVTQTGLGKNVDLINYFVRVFTEICMDKTINPGQMAGVLLSQANREGYKKAMDSGGKYDLTALAQANELERSSTYVITSYVDDLLRDSGEASTQLLKNRLGEVMETPIQVPLQPEYSTMGSVAVVGTSGLGSALTGFQAYGSAAFGG